MSDLLKRMAEERRERAARALAAFRRRKGYVEGDKLYDVHVDIPGATTTLTVYARTRSHAERQAKDSFRAEGIDLRGRGNLFRAEEIPEPTFGRDSLSDDEMLLGGHRKEYEEQLRRDNPLASDEVIAGYVEKMMREAQARHPGC